MRSEANSGETILDFSSVTELITATPLTTMTPLTTVTPLTTMVPLTTITGCCSEPNTQLTTVTPLTTTIPLLPVLNSQQLLHFFSAIPLITTTEVTTITEP